MKQRVPYVVFSSSPSSPFLPSKPAKFIAFSPKFAPHFPHSIPRICRISVPGRILEPRPRLKTRSRGAFCETRCHMTNSNRKTKKQNKKTTTTNNYWQTDLFNRMKPTRLQTQIRWNSVWTTLNDVGRVKETSEERKSEVWCKRTKPCLISARTILKYWVLCVELCIIAISFCCIDSNWIVLYQFLWIGFEWVHSTEVVRRSAAINWIALRCNGIRWVPLGRKMLSHSMSVAALHHIELHFIPLICIELHSSEMEPLGRAPFVGRGEGWSLKEERAHFKNTHQNPTTRNLDIWN